VFTRPIDEAEPHCPFLVIHLIVTGLLVAFPQIVLFLPELACR